MKNIILIGAGLFSLNIFAQDLVLTNWAGANDAQQTSCSVEPITTDCRLGGSVTAPGCSIACKVNQIAKCEQGQTYSSNCSSLPAKCNCLF